MGSLFELICIWKGQKILCFNRLCSLVRSFGSKNNTVFVGEILGLCARVLRVLPRINMYVCERKCERESMRDRESDRERESPAQNQSLFNGSDPLCNRLPFITAAHTWLRNHFIACMPALAKLNLLSSPLLCFLLASYQRDLKNCNILCFSESRLNKDMDNIHLSGFSMPQQDRKQQHRLSSSGRCVSLC